MTTYSPELQAAISIARSAGARILEFYNAHSASEYEKSDGSPVTDADLSADTIIREELLSRFPDDAIMTEESVDNPDRLLSRRCWIVDPLDGTAQFINRTGEFDVMIALVENHIPVVSVMYQPTTGLLYFASAHGGAWREQEGGPDRITMAQRGSTPVLAASLYYGGKELTATLAAIAEEVGAEQPDVLTVGYQPRRVVEPTWMFDAFVGLWPPDGSRFACEWDLAAPDLFTTEAGGAFTDVFGSPYRYNQPTTRIDRGLVVANDLELHQSIISAIGREFLLNR